MGLVGRAQGQLPIVLPELAGAVQLLADGGGGGVIVEGLLVAFEAGQALVQLLVGNIRADLAAEHQVTLGNALAEHALLAGEVEGFGITERGPGG